MVCLSTVCWGDETCAAATARDLRVEAQMHRDIDGGALSPLLEDAAGLIEVLAILATPRRPIELPYGPTLDAMPDPQAPLTPDEIRARVVRIYTGNRTKDLVGFAIAELPIAEAAWELEAMRRYCAAERR